MTNLRQSAYRRLTPEQFAAALEELGLTTEGFAWLTGSNARRVSLWRRGEEDIPPWVPLVCTLLTLPGAKAVVKDVTRHMTQVEPDFHDEPL